MVRGGEALGSWTLSLWNSLHWHPTDLSSATGKVFCPIDFWPILPDARTVSILSCDEEVSEEENLSQSSMRQKSKAVESETRVQSRIQGGQKVRGRMESLS